MKRILLYTLTILTASLGAQAQTFEWATSAGASSNDEARSICTDDSGNSYVTGFYRETVDFDPSAASMNLISNGFEDIFVQKFDPSGSLLWVKSMGSTMDDQGRSIAVDASGNVYSTGYFEGTVDFDPNAGTSNLTSVGAKDIYIQKLSSDGDLIWVQQMGGTSLDEGVTLAVDANGNVYSAGVFTGTVDFDPGVGTFDMGPSSLSDIYIQKLATDGSLIWAKTISGNSYEGANSIAIDNSNNVYTTGYFSGTSDFDPGAGTMSLVTTGGNDIFVLKLDVNGDFDWVNTAGNANNEAGQGIAIDNAGNVVTTGYYEGIMDFDPGVGIEELTAVGNSDCYVQKLDNAGNLIWVKNIGGLEWEYTYGIAIDSADNIYTAGSYNGTTDMDPSNAVSNLTPSGDYDNFVQKLTSAGEFEWAYSVGGPNGDLVFAINVDNDANVYTTGFFRDGSEFNPGTGSTVLTANGARDFYVHKMNQTVIIDDASLSSNDAVQFSLFPNPVSSNLMIESTETIESLMIFDLAGTLLLTSKSNKIAVSHLATGSYILQLKTAMGISQKRFIKY